MISKFFQGTFGTSAPHRVDDVESFVEFLEQRWDEFGGVLKIAVDDDDRASRGAIEPRRDRGLVTEIAAECADREPGIAIAQFGEETTRFVGRPVVNNNNFV